MGEPVIEKEEIIDMIGTSLILTVPNDDDDNRAFLTCKDCNESFLLVDSSKMNNPITSMIESLNMFPRLTFAIRHIIKCPANGDEK